MDMDSIPSVPACPKSPVPTSPCSTRWWKLQSGDFMIIANLKRYTMVIRRDENGFATPALKVRKQGEVVKFDELVEALPSASTNTARDAIAAKLLKRWIAMVFDPKPPSNKKYGCLLRETDTFIAQQQHP